MKRVRIPKFRYKARHRGGWLRGYDGPAKPKPEQHEGATETKRPGAEMRAAGEDPTIVVRAELYHDAVAEANEQVEERLPEVLKDLEWAEQFAAMRERGWAEWEDRWSQIFRQAARLSLLPRDREPTQRALRTAHRALTRAYVDAVRLAAEAEDFAHDAVTEDIYPTQELLAVA